MSFVSIDPQASPRQRRFDQRVANILNDLIRSGGLTLGAGGVWELSGGTDLASPSGLEFAAGLLRIDLAATTVLELHSSGLRFVAQNDNLFLAGPTSGGPSTPTFRGIAVSDIADALITYAKIQDVSAASRLLGRGSAAGAGDVQEITLGSNLTMSGTTLSATATTTGGGGGGLDPQSSLYPPFTPGANDDEFDNGSFTGWTAVNSGSNTPTVTETNHVASLSLPGGHAAAELAAYVKTATPSVGDYVECVVRGAGLAQNFNVAGVLMADGSTYGAGQQAVFHYSPAEEKYVLSDFSGYNTQDVFNGFNAASIAAAADTYLRLKYSAANTFRGFVSPDGVSWIDVTGPISITLSPTVIGFYVSTWGGTNPFVWSFRYFKHSA